MQTLIKNIGVLCGLSLLGACGQPTQDTGSDEDTTEVRAEQKAKALVNRTAGPTHANYCPPECGSAH